MRLFNKFTRFDIVRKRFGDYYLAFSVYDKKKKKGQTIVFILSKYIR